MSALAKRKLICVLVVILFVITSLLSVFCYDRMVYKLNPSPDLSAYVKQNYAVSDIVNQLDLKGISLIGFMNKAHEYNIVGYMKSPISSHYKIKPLEFSEKDYAGHGLICMLTPGLFDADFNLYNATNDNINELNMFYPYYFLFLFVRDEGFELEAAHDTVLAASWPVFKTQITPYVIICIFLTVFWLIVNKILTRKLPKTRDKENNMRRGGLDQLSF